MLEKKNSVQDLMRMVFVEGESCISAGKKLGISGYQASTLANKALKGSIGLESPLLKKREYPFDSGTAKDLLV